MFSIKSARNANKLQPNRDYFQNSSFIENNSSQEINSRKDLFFNKGLVNTSTDSNKLKQIKLPSISLSTRSKEQLQSLLLKHNKNKDESNNSIMINDFSDKNDSRQKSKSPLSILEKTHQNNEALYKRWMREKDLFKQFTKFYTTFNQFLKFQNNKFIRQFMNFFQFKPYLKAIFINDSTSLIQIQQDMDFKTFCIKSLQYSTYDQYLNEKYNVNQISNYKKLLKLQKQKINNKYYQALLQQQQINNLPSYQEFVKDILIFDLKIIVEQMEEFMIKYQTEYIEILGQQVLNRKKQIQTAKFVFIKQLQKKQNGHIDSPVLEQLKSKQVSEFDKGANISLLDNLQRIEMNLGNLESISKSNRMVYKKFQNVIGNLNTVQDDLLDLYLE